MYPLSAAAFTQAQASRRELSAAYKDALILDVDGSLRRIDHVEVIGPWGESIGRKLLSLLTGAWRIEVQLSEPMSYSLEEVKQILIDCSAVHVNADTMQMDSAEVEKFAASVRAASSIGQLLELLRLPAPEDALDVL
ncbi:hypothetical protein D9M68_808260 [compost metagenome]